MNLLVFALMQNIKVAFFRPVSLPESTKQLIALRQSVAENVEIPVNPSDLVMRGTIYQNSEAEQSSCPSPSPTSQSTQSLRERYSCRYLRCMRDHSISWTFGYFELFRTMDSVERSDRLCCCRYSGGGFVKKSFPFPKLSLQRRRRLMVLGSSRERMLRKHKKREKVGEDGTMGKSQGVREARYRKARKLLKNAIAKVELRTSMLSRDCVLHLV